MAAIAVDPTIVARAKAGDRAAQDEIVRASKDLVFNLSLKMLGSPPDAEDATQEILLKLITHLSSFRGDSAFRTWAYRVAANHLLNIRKRGAETRFESFDEMAEGLSAGLATGAPAAEQQVVINEAKMICTSTMLARLDRDHRLAFILGDILELPGDEGAAVLEIDPAAFRQRVSRARARMAEFMGAICGLVDQAAPCRCDRVAGWAVQIGSIDPSCLAWNSLSVQAPGAARARIEELDGISRAVEVFRGHPDYAAPDVLVSRLRAMLDSSTSDLFG